MIAYTFYESDNRVRRYAETLAQRGDTVDVIALRTGGQPSRETVNGIRVFRIQQRKINEKGKSSYLARLCLFFLRSMALVTREHIRKPYKLIHVHSIPDFEVFAAALPRLMGAKVILDIHDLVPEFYASKFNAPTNSLAFKLLVAIERLSAGFADHVIAANHLWEERLISRSVPKGKCTTFLNYPDTRIFRRTGRRRCNQKFIMIYPGTLSYHQGVDIALRALALIKEKAPEAEFHIYGRGDQRKVLADLIVGLKLERQAFLHDMASLDEVAQLIENADLGVVPKRKDGFGNEAFSTKIFEFMALGVPVVVPDTLIDRRYFNQKIVRFFRANDEHDLAQAMLQLMETPQIREELVKSADQFIKGYTWDLNKNSYLNLVDSLVGDNPNTHRS